MDMGTEPSMEGGLDPMIGDENPMNSGPNAMNDEDSMENGFDAGLDVNQEEDPKKYLQQLTGKLSQELRNYNQDQQKPDTELNKYIAGMIIPQATKDMTDKEKNDVINKIESNSVEDEGGIGDDFIGQEDEQSQDNEMPMESTNRLDKIINEIINSFNDEKKERNDKKIKIKNNKINPFVSKF